MEVRTQEPDLVTLLGHILGVMCHVFVVWFSILGLILAVPSSPLLLSSLCIIHSGILWPLWYVLFLIWYSYLIYIVRHPQAWFIYFCHLISSLLFIGQFCKKIFIGRAEELIFCNRPILYCTVLVNLSFIDGMMHHYIIGPLWRWVYRWYDASIVSFLFWVC